ncbi:5-dehydro-2-deoxygluconokinase [Orenia metallireducens]|jgi:2-dehydro-3-deoxygluconokinase|uniref:5-dehydro-2-deoxygluconokinase n=1 Tax=Orenia metallireducens TaxID=1413210 RepID=A0A285GFG5_9FIRM|nr:sugar kinase [Orenia metallireducens]PRX32487.1 5-dehydro-2-deoxygluconokinase [Orenia metallireducens]SNY21101.1 5-dehydro-2-deoxygluconokinase [Orenia metallireducens]
MIEVVTLGETMIVMNPKETGSLKYIYDYRKQLGGAESNFAIGVARLGHQTGWISKLGADPHGEYINSFIRGEGVDTSQVKFTSKAMTGLYFKERSVLHEVKAYYYRHISAASQMSPADLSEDYIAQAKYLHLTGITPALSDSCHQTILRAIEIAKENDVKVSFDPNLRLKLWDDKERMKEIMLELFKSSDIVLPGVEEGEILFGLDDPREIAQEILSLGAEIVVVKLGPAGALVADRDGMEVVAGYPVEQVVDTVGAGDGFAAGFIAGLLKGDSLVDATKLANAVGAYAVTVLGDVEGLPTMEEIEVFTGLKEGINR